MGHMMALEPVSELLPWLGLCGRSHLESGYVAKSGGGKRASPRWLPSCKRAEAVQPGLEGKGRGSPSWSRAGNLWSSILLVGTGPRNLIET